MYLNSKKIIRVTLVLLLQLVLGYQSFAANDPVNTVPLLGSENNVFVNKESFVTDAAFFNPLSPIEATHRIQNMVSVGIEEESKYAIQTDFTATVVLQITKYDQNHQVIGTAFEKTFVVDFKKAAGTKNNSVQYYPFENVYEVKVKIISVTPSSGVTWDISRVLRVDNTLTATRDYVFNCTADITGLTATLDTDNKELLTIWGDPHCGQTEYDLEWAWVDDIALEDYKDVNGFIQDKIFTNNATRVTVSSLSYKIPLLYDGDGRLFVRVRPAQIKYNGQRVEGKWAWKNPIGATDPVYYTYTGHENSLNWQVSTSFAEEGKRKSVIQYFDGTLRNRQTVTKDNSTNTTVVAETFYDYQGRPVIQLLPAPAISKIVQYTQNFNKSINFNDYDGYPKWVYDKLDANSSTCGNPAMAFSTTSGTAKYYSPANENVNTPATGYNANKYIANSEGPVAGQAFPFTETRFTPDGRVAAQSGVGYTHQLGSSHETKYLYEPPAQEELDALFGTDAGVASHYFKNLVKDANGQYSVSYTDMHGRTVATALAGDAPTQLDPLASINTKNFTKQLIDDETNRVLGKSIISTKALVVPKAGLYKFRYELNPEQLTLLSCTNQPVCYDCLYKLKITITSECNNLPGFTSPYTVVDSNFTIGQVLTDPQCNEGGKTTGFFNKYFEIILPEGTYTITKNLSLSDSAQDVYRDVFIKNDTCKTFQDFYDKEYQVLLAKSNCAITCVSCTTAIGNNFEAFKLKFIQDSGMPEPLPNDVIIQLQAAYKDALANCTRICDLENKVDDGMEAIRGIKQTMLLDVTPPFGQYAKYSKLEDLLNSKFNILKNTNPKNYTLSTGVPSPYKNEYGTGENFDVASLNVEKFSDQFKTSWADEALQYHPEYAKLQTIEQKLPATYQFEATLTKIKTWQAAANEGYINNIIASDPFFTGYGAAYAASMQAKMNSYAIITSNVAGCTNNATISPSMWQIAQATVFCRNITLTPPCNLEQSQCLITRSSTPSLIPATGCATDWDFVWQTYRSLYLTERKKFIAEYIASTPNKDQEIKDYNASLPATEAVKKLKLRIINFNDNNGTGDLDAGDLQTFFNELAAGNNNAITTANNLAKEQYKTTCLGYTDMWLAQLAQCPAIEARWAVPNAVYELSNRYIDSVWLTTRLVKICEYGSDQYHYLGASSIDPLRLSAYIADGGSSSLKDFPDVISQYLSTFIIPAVPVDEVCHPYLITSPAPFNKQAAVTNQLIITKPTDCECARLTALKTEYTQRGAGFATFSAYLKSRYGTIITQGALDTLTNLCNGTYSCIFLPAPIVLPPVLQCQGNNGETVKPCIDCKDFQAIKNGFTAEFGKQAPVKEPVTQTDFDVNKAFEKFANYKTGFSKNIIEYISFIDSCGGIGNAATPACDSLKNILDSFYVNYYNKPAYPIAYNADGCDTTAWLSSIAPIFTNITLNAFKNLFSGGAALLRNGYLFDYNHPICISDSFKITYRVKFPLSSSKYRHYNLPISLNTSTGVQTLLFTLFSTAIATSSSAIVPNAVSVNLGAYFQKDVWYDLSIKFRASDGQISVYTNDSLVLQRLTGFANISSIEKISIQPQADSLLVDNVKIDNANSDVVYNETFDNACQGFAVINPKNDCSKLPCQQAFVNYFNTKKGTNYTFAQIDALYFSTCGIHPTPCVKPGPCTPLEQLISNFQSQYIKPATGYVDYDMRTFAGNKTLDAGPKGVFDINKNLIGNTVNGTPTQIKQSYAQVWNSSTVNQSVGALSVLTNGKFRLTLNPGQTAPCDGIVGMRFYQFDGAIDTLDAPLVGPGCYIDFGDGNKEAIVKGLDARGTKTFYNQTQSPISPYYGYDSVATWQYVVHFYADSSLKTITVYHTDVQGFFGFDNWYVLRPIDRVLDITKFKNLRGYMPQQTISILYHSTQNSSFNTMNNIINFNEINSVRTFGVADGNYGNPGSVNMIKNTNFSSFANNHNLSSLDWTPHNLVEPVNYNIQNGFTLFPNIKANFPNLKWLRLTDFFGEYTSSVDISGPSLKGFAMQGYLNSEQVDSMIIQVSRSLQDSGVIELYDYDGVTSLRTSASDAAYNSLASRGWSLRGGGMSLNNTPPATLNLPIRDSFPLTNNFTEFYNLQYGTNYSYNQLMALLKTQYGYTPDYCTLISKTCGSGSGGVTTGPVLCGLNKALFEEVKVDENPCKDIAKFALTAAEEKWQLYVDSLRNVFDTAYYNKCMAAKDLESFTVNYNVSEYHYTLYYYDQAGNLIKTVPPAGVDSKHGNPTFLADVKAARLRVKNGALESDAINQKLPGHTLVTQYRYNTLNQVVAQKTPDAGLSEFWYDRLGRLVVSQNAKQKTTNRYSYTLYDELGRITEVGQKPQSSAITQAITRSEGGLATWLSNNGASTNVVNKEQITRTRYDLTYDEGSNILGASPSILVQRNLRNRVSYTMVFNNEPPASSTTVTHNAATYYTYDIHGNVDTLLQDLRASMLAISPTSNRYKKLVYDYDLISGKVNKVSYQPGKLDEFYHKYLYDAENRLTEVYTSHDNLIWEKDARYSYYKHGPMARTILGQQQVQGIDYAYTLQGWLKGVNSTAVQRHTAITGNGEDCGPESAVQNLAVNARLTPLQPQYIAGTSITFNPGFESVIPADNFSAYIDNTLASCGDGTAGTEVPPPLGNMFDMGTDGVPAANGTANQVSNDVYGYNLNYFTGDYKPINSAVTPFANVTTPLPGSTTGSSLYNGNISSLVVNIPKLGHAQLYGYRYDQLNRIVAMDAFTGLNGTTNTWAPVATQKYKERITYDPNGNILTYKRNGNAARLAMDDMAYAYKPGTNQLDKVTDAAPDAAAGEYDKYNDIKQGQANANYQYDEIGNLISDVSEGITNISWSVYGKILSIAKSNGTTINYTYDASGNRISKVVVSPSGGGGGTTIYVRDASGNVMSVYTADPAISPGNLMQTEVHLYGSSRLGIFEVNRNVQTLVASNYSNNINTFTRGNKFFELSNHLGNVLVTISDKKIAVASTTDPNLIAYYNADVVTANDYYPGGSQMPGRKFTQANSSYRYGFNGQEKSDDLTAGNYTAMFWEYDSRIGRRWNVDPVYKNSPYECFNGNPILLSDPSGADPEDPKGKTLPEVIVRVTISKKQAALNKIASFKGTANSTFGGSFSTETFKKQLTERVNNPYGLDQGHGPKKGPGGTNFCWIAAAMSYNYAKHPSKMVDLMINLFSNGDASMGNMAIGVTQSLRDAVGSNTFDNDGGLKGQLVDQLLFMSIAGNVKGYVNLLNLSYDKEDEDATWASGNFSKFNKLMNVFGNKVESRGQDAKTCGVSTIEIMDAQSVGKTVMLFVFSASFKNPPPRGSSGDNLNPKNVFGTHFIQIRNVTQDGDNLKMDYWDYGGWTKDHIISVESLRNCTYGILTTK
jgi:hypothetical protein